MNEGYLFVLLDLSKSGRLGHIQPFTTNSFKKKDSCYKKCFLQSNKLDCLFP